MRKLMVKLVAACFTVLLFVTIFMGRTMFTSMAKEESAATPYYKSVRIQEGDSLWELANQYKDGSSMSTHEYVDQLRQMNSLLVHISNEHNGKDDQDIRNCAKNPHRAHF